MNVATELLRIMRTPRHHRKCLLGLIDKKIKKCSYYLSLFSRVVVLKRKKKQRLIIDLKNNGKEARNYSTLQSTTTQNWKLKQYISCKIFLITVCITSSSVDLCFLGNVHLISKQLLWALLYCVNDKKNWSINFTSVNKETWLYWGAVLAICHLIGSFKIEPLI